MARTTSSGKCTFCGGTFGKAAMTRHLTTCKLRPLEPEKAPGRRLRPTQIYHLVVSTRYGSTYWMHLEAPATATLEVLDDFLRRTWLECCGHLSAFELGSRSFSSAGPDWDGPEDEDMDVPLGKLVAPGTTLSYDYDFGSTTRLVIRVVGQREGLASRPEIRLLAGNDPPTIPCAACRQPAVEVCAECAPGGAGWVCQACAPEHGCGEDMLLPVVNSPRIGVCGYDGPGLMI